MTRLEDFVVLKSLTVRDIEIERARVSALYEAEHPDGEIRSTRLIYSYQEPLFNKNNAADVNLASIMLAQVALNYGLFCE